MSEYFTTVDTFKYWCHKILPLVYDDSLSYYEQLCKVVSLLNQVIENVNNIPEYIGELVKDERLKALLSALLDEFREQIANANEKDSETATSDRSVGELVWLNGKLYRCIQQLDAGDKYVEASNIEKVTIEDVITDLQVSVATYIEVNQTNASKDIDYGEWFWFKNELCRALKDIDQGNSYVKDVNYEIITVETMCKNVYYPQEELLVMNGIVSDRRE